MKTSPLPNNYSGDPLATSYFQDPTSNPGVEEYGATQPVSPVKDATGAQAGPLLPVVGWLVCIDGPAKGRDYRIPGRNIVRVNGKTVMVSVELKAYDELTIGSTKLLFVPLCGERFNWNGK